MFRTLGLACWALAVAGAAQAQSLKLQCAGTSSRTVADVSTLSASDIYGHTATGDVTRYRRSHEDVSVGFELADGAARIQLPRDMVPLISGGGVQGWWNVSDLQVTDDEIVGRYALNVISHPRIRIDRHTGVIEIEGRRAFHGECQNVKDVPRRF